MADFAPQPVITKDNVTMQIDTVIYFQITDPKLYTCLLYTSQQAGENLQLFLLIRPSKESLQERGNL